MEKMLGAPSWASGTGENQLPGTTLLWLHGENSDMDLAQRLAGSAPGPRRGSALERHPWPQPLPLRNTP